MKVSREFEVTTRSKKVRRSLWVLVKDLELLAALYVAHFIVWRELRRCEREEAARRKSFKFGRTEF